MENYTQSSVTGQFDSQWFLLADDGAKVGPFNDMYDLQMASVFHEREAHWPTQDELNRYVVLHGVGRAYSLN